MRSIFIDSFVYIFLYRQFMQDDLYSSLVKSCFISIAMTALYYFVDQKLSKHTLDSFGSTKINFQENIIGLDPESLNAQYAPLFNEHGIKMTWWILTTHDAARLNTLTLKSTKHITEKYIIILNENYNCTVTNDMSWVTEIVPKKMGVVFFDYRGVGDSTKDPHKSITLQDLCTDGIAQVQRLKAQNVDSNSILLIADSNGLLGKSVAQIVATHFDIHYITIESEKYRSDLIEKIEKKFPELLRFDEVKDESPLIQPIIFQKQNTKPPAKFNEYLTQHRINNTYR